MELFVKEEYSGTKHYWYKIDLMKDHEYGQIFNSDFESITEIVEVINKDLLQDKTTLGMYWYFGSEVENIVMMIRHKNNEFEIQINLKDFDFALNIDEIVSYREKLYSDLELIIK